jgi:two-component system KDP operon response regulator KdpE
MSGDRPLVLIVDDERAILRFLRPALEEGGYSVCEASNGRAALDLAVARRPDVILLDLSLPGLDGLDVLSRLREWSSAPVIVVSARGQQSDKVAGFDRGADDYLTKPFGVEELLARIRVALRRAERSARAAEPVYEHDDLKIDLSLRRVWLAKREVRLSPLQYALLAALAREAGRVVEQKRLLRELWPGGGSTPEALRILVHQTRHRVEKVPARPRHLKTEPAVGYRLEAPDD